jgi:hypothetical protein
MVLTNLMHQDLASSMDEGDVAKFTEAIREFDSMTRLVCLSFLFVICFSLLLA